MTRKMIEWQIGKVSKMQSLDLEIMDGIEDALTYISEHPQEIDPKEMEIIGKLISACRANLEACKEILLYLFVQSFCTKEKEISDDFKRKS